MNDCILIQSIPKNKREFLKIVKSKEIKTILCLSFESRSFLEKYNLKYDDTLPYFNNKDHKICLRTTNIIRRRIRDSISTLDCGLKNYDSFSIWLSNYLIFKHINHKLFIYRVLKNFFEKNNFKNIYSYGSDIYFSSEKINKKFKLKTFNIINKEFTKNKGDRSIYKKIKDFINLIATKLYNSLIKVDYNDSALYFSSMYNVLDYKSKKKKFLIQTNDINFLKVLKLFLKGIITKFYLSNSDKAYVSKQELSNFFKKNLNLFYEFINFDKNYIINDLFKNINTFSNILLKFNNDTKECTNLEFISPFSFGISGILGELVGRSNNISVCIPHGTCSPDNNNYYDFISNYEIGESILINNFSNILIQSMMSNNSADLFKITSKKIFSKPIAFSVISNNFFDRRTFLHASTFKNNNNFKFYLVETFDEYISSLKDLCKLFEKLNYNLIIQPHPSLKEYISIQDFKKILNLNTKNINITENSFKYNLSISNVLISFSSTTIEEFLLSRKPVILFDKWKRYNHCGNFIDKNNYGLSYFNKIEELGNSLDSIYLSSLKENRYFDKFSLKIN